MMAIRQSIFGISLVLAGLTPLHTAVAAQALSGERLYIAKALSKELSESDDRLRPGQLVNAIKVVDIDHDGTPDYIVDHAKTINTHYCGADGGCNFEIWHGIKWGHPVRVWNRMVRQYKIAHRRGETVFDFDFHGSTCGTFGVSLCPASFAWDRGANRLVERPTAHGDTQVRFIDPIPMKLAQVPASIMVVVRAAKTKCAAFGASDELILPETIPDIDGDGQRDWSLTLQVCSKRDTSTFKQVLFATLDAPQSPKIVATGPSFRISFATKPASVARVEEGENCGGFSVNGKPCSQRPMIWNRATKTLTLAPMR
jgi:hypothetical protein